jgi:hypothetical protein
LHKAAKEKNWTKFQLSLTFLRADLEAKNEEGWITQPAAETVVVIFACDKSVFFKIVFSLFNSNKLY